MKPPLPFFTTLFLFFGFLSSPIMAASTGHPGSLPILLGLDSVRKELGLTKKQCAKLDQIRSDFKTDARLITTRFPASPVERRAANSTVKSLAAKYNEKAVAVLTPKQNERLLQIERQMLGGLMLCLPREQKQLGLSTRQIAAIEKIHAAGEGFASRIAESYEKGDITLAERLDTLRNYRIKQSAKYLRLLSPSQRKTFQSLQGQEFMLARAS